MWNFGWNIGHQPARHAARSWDFGRPPRTSSTMRLGLVFVAFGVAMWAMAFDAVSPASTVTGETAGAPPAAEAGTSAATVPEPAAAPAVRPADLTSAPPRVAEAPAAADTPSTAADGGAYTVAAGDTMARIARAHDVSLAALLAANPGIEDASRIHVGQRVVIPD